VLIVEANPRLLSNYIGIKVMKSWDRPVIGWGLGILEWPTHNGWSAIRRDLHKMFYGRFNALIAYSTKGARDYQFLGIPEERIFIAPNAVSNENADRLFEKLKQEPDSIKVWRARLGLADRPTVLYVGRLTSPKRVDDLILTCARVNDPVELLVVGDGSERPRLEALAKGVLPTARFLGHLEGEQLALCFAVSDLFVLPGPGGLAVQEAMAYGKPVVVASGDGTQVDLVREGKNGFHVTPGDISALTAAINKCIYDQKLLRQMDQESRRIIQEEYNLDVMVESFLKALDLVLRRK
jgi:glycosyltransferase involved in cell wall biosynthesis